MDMILKNIVPIGTLLSLVFACYLVEFLLRRRAVKAQKRSDNARWFGYLAVLLVLALTGFLIFINAGTEWVLAAVLLALFGAML